MGHRVWRIGVYLYGLAACCDFAYHVAFDVRSADWAIRYSQLPVAFSAALFWPLDIVAKALLATL